MVGATCVMNPFDAVFILIAVVLVLCVLAPCCCNDDDPADQPVEESAEQRVARATTERQAPAASTAKAAAAPVLVPLPYFPYAAQRPQSDKPSETVNCAICLDPLRPGQLCSEVPPCHHVFHGDCLGIWARSNGSCPLCRAKIVPGSDEVAIADDMV